MINPYEAPQTLTKPATRVIPRIDPDLAVLQGAKYCARGGKLLMAGALSELLGIGDLIWIQSAKQHGPTGLLNLFGWILLASCWLLLLAGAVMNLPGYARFVRYLDHDALVKLFRRCRKLSWLKIILVIGLIVFYDALFLGTTYRVQRVLLPPLLISLMYSYYVHARAMRIWSEHYPDSNLSNVRRLYLWSGLGGCVLVFGLYAPVFEDEKGLVLYFVMVVALCFVLSFAAFAIFYGRLSKALKIFESDAEIAAAND